MASFIQLSSQVGQAPINQAALREVGYQPLVDHTTHQDKSGNGTSQTFDGYEFKTDWNGSSNYLRTNNGNISATSASDGLRMYTSEGIGKDRRMWYQLWDRFESNMWLPNVIGFTGMMRLGHPQTHVRLDMVCFHYMDREGNRAGDYRPTETLRPFNSSAYLWTYGNTGQHTSGVDWYIGYQLPANRRSTVWTGGLRLHGISLDFKYRTGGTSRNAEGIFYNWKPIIADSSDGAVLADQDTCKSGKRLVIPAYGNKYPNPSTSIKLT